MMIWKQKKNLVMILENSQVIGNYHWFWSLEIINDPYKFPLEPVKDPRRGGLALWWGVGLKNLLARNGLLIFGRVLVIKIVVVGAFWGIGPANLMVCGTRRCFRWSIIYKKGVFLWFCTIWMKFWWGVCGSFGQFWEKNFFGHENSRRLSVFDDIFTERLEIASRFIIHP